MISSQLEQYVDAAGSYAKSCMAPSTSLVHILLSFLDDDEFKAVLAVCGVSYLDLRQEVIEVLSERMAVERQNPGVPGEGLSALCVYSIEASKKKAMARGAASAGVLDFVAAMLEIHDNGSFDFQARIILTRAGITVSNFSKARDISALSEGVSLPKIRTPLREHAHHGAERRDPVFRDHAEEHAKPKPALAFCVDMTAQAREGLYDRSHGREDVLSALQVVLSRRKKRSAVLVGDPGVGKTSVVEELAYRIAEGTVGPKLADVTILSLDVGSLVGGTKYRGELEERVKVLVAELSADPNLVLFVDEVHTLVSPTHSAGVAADLLKPALASGAIRCIGATTLAEYKKYFEADAAMSRRFAALNVVEPTRSEAIDLLSRAAGSYEEFHGLKFPDWAFETAVDLSIRLMPERRLPDKALELLDDVAARASMSGLSSVTRELFFERAFAKTGRKTDPVSVMAAVAMLGAGLSDIAKAALRNSVAPGHGAHAVAVIGPRSRDMKQAVKSVAAALGRSYEYLDMADFRDASSVSALLGPPPGYVGFDNGGRLYDAVRRSPDCLLHLLNIDQSHPTALATVSECMSNGYVRDTTGRVASLSAVQFVVSMATGDKRASIGFSSNASGEMADTGIELVDTAETLVELGEYDNSGRTSEALDKLVQAAKSAGTRMMLAEGIHEHIDGLLKSSNTNWSREFSRLVRRPVLDYLVSRSQDFVVEPFDLGIRIATHET